MKNSGSLRKDSKGLKARLVAGTALPFLLSLAVSPALAQSGPPPCPGVSTENAVVTACSSGLITAQPGIDGVPSRVTVDSVTLEGDGILFVPGMDPMGSTEKELLVTGQSSITVLGSAGVRHDGFGGITRVIVGSEVKIGVGDSTDANAAGVSVGAFWNGSAAIVNGGQVTAMGDGLRANAQNGDITVENGETGIVKTFNGRGIIAEAGIMYGLLDAGPAPVPTIVQVTNRGSVDAYSTGIEATNRNGTVGVLNMGNVASMVGHAISVNSEAGLGAVINNMGTADTMEGVALRATAFEGMAYVTNSGTATSKGEYGAGIETRAYGMSAYADGQTPTLNQIVNSGSVQGYDGIRSRFGSTRIENSGTIESMGGHAILLGTGSHELILKQGSGIVGDISAGGSLSIDAQTDTAIAGNILDGGYLPTFSLMASPVSSALSLTKKGVGILTLSGENTYSGGTTIEAGVLQVSKDSNLGAYGPSGSEHSFAALKSDPVEVTNGGGITIAGGTLRYLSGFDSARSLTVSGAGGTIDTNGNDASMSGTVTGVGNLNKTGLGTLALSGDGSGFGGVLAIDQGGILLTGKLGGTVDIRQGGSLFVGNGVKDGDLLANTVNNGTLVFNQTADYDYKGDLSGSGALRKQGPGLLLLSGHYGYTGSTIVEGGSVRLAAGLSEDTDLKIDGGTFDLSGRDQTVSGLSGQSGTLLLGNGNLVVNQNVDAVFGGSIDGSGTFTKSGSNRLNLTGDSTFTGGTFVNQGLLSVNGSLSGSPVTTQSGGILGGTGTVGGIIGGNGGTVAPGNSIGTLKVAGDVSFGVGSVYEVEVNAAGQGDRIDATGKALLTGGTVRVLAGNGDYKPTTTYTILTATNGREGTFAGVTSNLAFLTPSLAYDANNVLLTMARKGTDGGGDVIVDDGKDVEQDPVRFSSVALTRNQFNTAESVESIGIGNPVFDVVLAQSVDGARQAFDALSGEVHAGVKGTLIEDSRIVRDAVLNRFVGPSGADMSKWGFWGQGFGSWGHSDRTANAGKLDRSTAGFLIGIDGEVGNAWRVGFAGGYTSTSLDLDARNSSASIDSYHAAIYGGTRLGNFGIRLGGAYAWHDVDASRSVSFPGFSDSLRSKYNARTGQVFGEIGYLFDLGKVKIEPIAGLTYVNVDVDGFRENGGAAALYGIGGSQDVTYSTLGARFSTDLKISEGTTLTARGMVGWRHAFGGVTPNSLMAFGGGGNPFTVSSLPIAKDAFVAEAGIGMKVGKSTTVSISYGGQYARKVQDHSIKAGLEVRF